MLQCLSLARDSPRRFLSSVAECKILWEAFDTVVNLRCSIRFVKPAEGGEAQVKAALPLGRGCCWIGLLLRMAGDGFVSMFVSLLKKKKPIFPTKAM